MQEIASREFMDNLTSLVKAYGAVAPNEDVKAKILELIQAWAGAAEGRSNLNYITEVYKSLQREGFSFPQRTEVASSMFDSNAVCMDAVIQDFTDWRTATRMDRFGRLPSLPDGLHLH